MIIRTKSVLAGVALAVVFELSGRAAVIHVPAEHSTIQAAVAAAASNDTIQVAAGVYTEQVLITNKTLTLSGSPGAVLRATAGLAQTMISYGYRDVALLGVALSDVKVSGLTFEGERLGDSWATWFDAVGCFASKVSIENCRITGFRGTNLLEPTTPEPTGIFFYNPVRAGTGVMNLDVHGCLFADNGISIWVAGSDGPNFDPTVLRTSFAVNDNTIVGNGPDRNGRQMGVLITAGAGGELKRNIVTGHDYIGPTPVQWSHGILAMDLFDLQAGKPLAALQPIQLEGNVFRNNQQGLTLLRGDGSIVINNSFEGRVMSYRPGGLFVTGNDVLIGTNRFSDLETGITLMGNDPDWRTSFGIASNITLIANGFCNVDTNYTFQPLSSHTEQGTLTCPSPKLNIQTVLLPWPFSYNGDPAESMIR